MTKLRRILKSNHGNAYPIACAIILGILLIFSVVWEYTRINIIVTGVRDSLQSAVIAVAVENYANVYSGVREGYSASYEYDNYGWIEVIDTKDVYARMAAHLGLSRSSAHKYVKNSGDGIEFVIRDLEIQIINSPLAPATPSGEEHFMAESIITLEVPFSFGWQHIPPLEIRLKVISQYMQKF